MKRIESHCWLRSSVVEVKNQAYICVALHNHSKPLPSANASSSPVERSAATKVKKKYIIVGEHKLV